MVAAQKCVDITAVTLACLPPLSSILARTQQRRGPGRLAFISMMMAADYLPRVLRRDVELATIKEWPDLDRRNVESMASAHES